MVVQEARTWINTPYGHQKAMKGRAADCIGVVRGVGRDLEIMDFDEHDPEHRKWLAYPMTPRPSFLVAALNTFFVRVREGIQRGDIVLFAIPRMDMPSHLGIISDVTKGTVIHALRQTGYTRETRFGANLTPSGVWRYPGVAYPAGVWNG